MARRLASFVPVVALVFAASIAAWATPEDTVATAMRKITAKNSKAVVTVEIVVEQSASYGGESDKREQRSSATGTMIDPSGLVIASLTEIDPVSAGSPEASRGGFSISSKVVEATLRLEDGTEIPADVVLRDRDLDLAFLRPKSRPAKPLPYLNLSKSGQPLAFNEVVCLYRLGQVAGRSIAGVSDRVTAVVTKPRRFYVIQDGNGLGGPAFTLDGSSVGIVVFRVNPSGKQFSFLSRFGGSDALTVILPCSTIADAAAHAKSPKK